VKRFPAILAIAAIGVASASSAIAETLIFPSFQVEIQDGWEHSIEGHPGDSSRKVINISHPNGAGSVRMLSYRVPTIVSKDMLRNVTNVDSSTPLTWQSWGDFSGYQYEYMEQGKFYRQWWLASDGNILFITYQCDPELRSLETEAIDKIVRSIKVNTGNKE
jgi:hypothetical protein